MRLVFIHQDLFFQGGERVTALLASGLASRGHEVHVVVSKVHADIAAAHPDEKPFPLSESVNFHVLPHRKAVQNVMALNRLLQKLNADVVLPSVSTYNQCAVLAKYLGGVRAKIVYIEHNLASGRVPCTLREKFLRWCLRRDDRIVGVSDGVCQAIKRILGTDDPKVVRIYNPVLGLPTTAETSVIHPWLKEKKGFTFVSAGALSKGKGFEGLIAAFEKVHAQHPTARLVIFGKGVLHDTLVRQIEDLSLADAVCLAGFTNCLHANLKAADCFVLNSEKETFSIVLVEALAAGCRVISSDCPVGPREVLEDGELGVLVPVGDTVALAQAMIRVCEDWGVSRKLREDWGIDYRLESVIERYEHVLTEVSRCPAGMGSDRCLSRHSGVSHLKFRNAPRDPIEATRLGSTASCR